MGPSKHRHFVSCSVEAKALLTRTRDCKCSSLGDLHCTNPRRAMTRYDAVVRRRNVVGHAGDSMQLRKLAPQLCMSKHNDIRVQCQAQMTSSGANVRLQGHCYGAQPAVCL